jgi:hypothetical protein
MKKKADGVADAVADAVVADEVAVNAVVDDVVNVPPPALARNTAPKVNALITKILTNSNALSAKPAKSSPVAKPVAVRVANANSPAKSNGRVT